MGRVDVNKDVTLEADDSVLDGLEDFDAPVVIDMEIMNGGIIDAEMDDTYLLAKDPTGKNTRRRLEDKLEDLRLQHLITDYDFNLH